MAIKNQTCTQAVLPHPPPPTPPPCKEPVHAKLLSLFAKAGYEVVYPEGLASSCCGMMFNSRGFKDAAATKGASLEQVGRTEREVVGGCAGLRCAVPAYLFVNAHHSPRPPACRPQSLLKASEGGKYPIVMDTSPCLSQVKAGLSDPALRCGRAAGGHPACPLAVASECGGASGSAAAPGDLSHWAQHTRMHEKDVERCDLPDLPDTGSPSTSPWSSSATSCWTSLSSARCAPAHALRMLSRDRVLTVPSTGGGARQPAHLASPLHSLLTPTPCPPPTHLAHARRRRCATPWQCTSPALPRRWGLRSRS